MLPREDALMAALAEPPLVATQLSIPPRPSGLVDRPRLRAALERAADGPLTLVSGPAGSGKTVLLSSTFAARGESAPVAWVSLDPGDDRPGRLAAAIAAVLPGDAAADAVAPRHALRSMVAGALADVAEPLVLVLDDVHVLRARACLAALADLVTHPPAGLRLVLSSRSDPVLPLHLARLHGTLSELRARDLAFNVPETRALLLAHGLELPQDLVATVCRRTEGWAAGVRLAALGLQRCGDHERFVAEFAGDDRVVADYLVAEVLHGEHPRRRAFLLRTSIAERLSGDLADALTGRRDGAATLEALERENGFVVALDAHGGWYRLHRLFAELLRAHARRALGDELLALHRRAAQWHLVAGDPAGALRHAAQACDWDLATDLIGEHWLELAARSEAPPLRAVLAQIPPERRETDPRLTAVLACLELEAGEVASADRHLAHAENGVASLPERCRARQLGTLAVARLRRAHAEGSAERARGPAGELLDEATPRDGWARALRHAVAHLQLGAANAWRANPEPALEELRQALALARAAGLRGVALSALGRLALVQAVRAGPVPARDLAAEALDEAEAHDLAATPDAAPAHVADAAIALSELRLADAGAALAAARGALGEAASADLGATLELLAAELDAARGDAVGALRRSEALALRAETPAARTLLPPLAALRARVLCDQLGDVAGARAVLAAAVPSELRTAELDVAAARAALAGGDPAAALAAVERARAARVVLGVTPVEVALLAALAHEQLRDPEDADAALEHALGLAATTGHHGVFVAAGRSLEPLLRRRIRRRTAYAALVCGLLDAAQHGAPAVTRAAPPLLEPLSDREAMILRYLPTSLSNREIAGELFVSTNTVKTHLRSIYRKLDVGGRREAVERARALRLVAAGARR